MRMGLRTITVFVLTIAIIMGNFIPSPEVPVVSGENPYNVSNFINLGNASTMGYGPDLFNDELIFIQSGHRMDNPSMKGIWIINTSTVSNKVLLYESEKIVDKPIFGRSQIFSPNGEMIVFVQREKTQGFHIILLKNNGTIWEENSTTVKTIYISPQSKLQDPSFSPDGKKIVFHSYGTGFSGDIWVIDIDGSNKTRLTYEGTGGYCPSYSPDGAKIVYTRSNSRGYEDLWIMNSDGSNQKRLLDDSWYPTRPVFMPDGRILFESGRFSPQSRKLGAPSIWMMNMDGSNRILLVPNRISSVGSTDPTINRDGTRIAFEHGFGSHFSLYIVDCPDGGLWKDSDGDGVADICDGYPDDPTRGYYIDDEKIPGFTTGAMVSSVLIAVPAIRRRMRVRGDRHSSPPADRGQPEH